MEKTPNTTPSFCSQIGLLSRLFDSCSNQKSASPTINQYEKAIIEDLFIPEARPDQKLAHLTQK